MGFFWGGAGLRGEVYLAIYCTTTGCFALKGLHTIIPWSSR